MARAQDTTDLFRRKKVTFAQRVALCQTCKYPLSQQHHLFPVARYGVSENMVSLCANCHELYHVVYNAYHRQTLHAVKLLAHFLLQGEILAQRTLYFGMIVHSIAKQIPFNEETEFYLKASIKQLCQEIPSLLDTLSSEEKRLRIEPGNHS